LKEIAGQCKRRGYSFYVIGDVPSPTDFAIEGCDFYSIERQHDVGFKIAKLLPMRHYSRKNIGYLLSMRSRPQYLIETDDDNMPLPGFWDRRKSAHTIPSVSGTGWTNVYTYFSDATAIWPRGLPLDAIRADLPPFESLNEVESDCPIQQGLADGNPDVDAIYRLILPLPISFITEREVALGNGSWCPFNSQNTTWFPKAYPLLYLPSYCTFRMTDIWRSFVTQRIAWENGWSVLFKSSDVVQDRNEHSLMRDFKDETPGYLHNREIGTRLEKLKLASGPENVGDNLILCYEAMVELGVVGADEIALVKAWVDDFTDHQNQSR
jgi:hypothetical protein